jgi:hypothetical protein
VTPTQIIVVVALLGFLPLSGWSPQPVESEGLTSISAGSQTRHDLAGYWLSGATQGWRHLTVVPVKVEYQGIPMNPVTGDLAGFWNATADGAAAQSCKAYGSGLILWTSGFSQSRWVYSNALRVESDAGRQTRPLRLQPTANEVTARLSRQGPMSATWGGAYAAFRVA